MAHVLQERYSSLVDVKLRATLVTKDGVIFNTRYEGDPTAGAVNVPVRDTEVVVGDYNRQSGLTPTNGDTAYIKVVISNDKAVNEIIDGYEAAAVPDNLKADRLDSAGYSLGLTIEADAIATLEAEGTTATDTVASTAANIYTNVVAARTYLSNQKVPLSQRFCIINPDTYALLLTSSEFIRQGDLSQELLMTGAIGQIAGFAVYESTELDANTEFICGHPDWCTRVQEWQVPVTINSLTQSGTYIGASAVQGRKIFEHKVTKANTVYVKTKA